MAKQAAAIADSHELSGRSHETFSSFSKMPNIGDSGSQLVCQLGPSKTIISNSESILIKVITLNSKINILGLTLFKLRLLVLFSRTHSSTLS